MNIEEEILLLFEPLTTVSGIQTVLEELNLIVSSQEYPLPLELTDFIEQGGVIVSEMSVLVHSSGNSTSGETLTTLLGLAQTVYEMINAISSISVDENSELLYPFNDQAFWTDLGHALPGYLIQRWIRNYHPVTFQHLDFLSIFHTTSGSYGINFEQLGALLSSPEYTLIELVTFDGEIDLSPLSDFIRGLMALLALTKSRQAVRMIGFNSYEGEDTPVHDAGSTKFNLIPPGLETDGQISFQMGIEETGLTVKVDATGETALDFPIGNEWSVGFDITGGNSLSFQFLPESGLVPDSDSLAASASLSLSGVPETPWNLIGAINGPRLSLAGTKLAIDALFAGSNSELNISLSFDGLKLIILPADGDSFIRDVLPIEELSLDFDTNIAWSSETGFTIAGGVTFETTIPLNLNLGPISITTVRIGVAADADGVELELATSGGIDLTVLSIVIDDIGIRAMLAPSPEGLGNLGAINGTLAFKPPSGLGLVIDAGGIVTGGGYIEHDEDKGQYAGVAQIGFLTLDLSAIGVLTTKMPDGSDGWSLFLSVFSEFPPLQLGFGFTLNGVGGLIGINRTLDDEALRERLLQGALDSIMFPDDPVANAPTIINDIEAVFPAAQGQFIFGAMMKVGWGTPSLLTVDLGVMVELPDPIRIALLGQLESILPTRDIRILELHMDVFGLADLTAQTLALDAVIRDSHIVDLLTLSGDMSMRADLLDQPTMLLSIGGFHPDFKAPAEFPTIRRMQASIPVGALAKIDLACYVAFTSNTFQMGGRVDVWAKFVGFTAEGFLEADALIQFVPFGFAIHIGFGATVKAGSITLMGVEVHGNLLGPSPWEVFGTATFEILGFKKDINLEISVGKDKENIVEQYDIEALLVEALSKAENWSVPEEGELSSTVRLREQDADETATVHPAGQVQVIQKLVPLEVAIEVFGGTNVVGQDKFSIDRVRVGDDWRDIEENEFIQDWFAPAQFFNMSDAEKVKAPSFEMMDGGIRFGSVAVGAGHETELEVEYEEIFIDPSLNQRRMSKIPQPALSADWLSKVEGLAATEKHRLQNARFKTQTVEPKYQVSPQRYVSLDAQTGGLASAITHQRGKTYAEVESKVRKNKTTSILGVKGYEVVPREELLTV